MITLSASAIKKALRCQQLWNLTYEHKKEPINDGSFELSYGKTFHELLEGGFPEYFGPGWNAVVNEHLIAYQSFYATDDVVVIAREVPFEFNLTSDIRLHGYLDAIVRIGDKYYIQETKTTGKITPEYWDRREQDVQVGIYLLAAQEGALNYPISGVIYDVTSRPGIRKKRNEEHLDYVQRVADWYYDNQETAFERRIMTRTAEQLDELAGDIMMLADQLQQKKFVRNRDSCYNFRKKCGFYDVCFNGESLDNTELYQIRKSSRTDTGEKVD